MSPDTQHGVEILLRGIHALMVAAWLLFDFIVFWLHFKVKDPAANIDERLERARVMHGVDTVVAYLFILTLPVGLALCRVTGTPVFTTDWLSWKHLLYGVIVVAAVVLIPVSGTALRNLTAIKAGAPNAAALNEQIRHDMDRGMPWVMLIWTLIIVMSLISIFNIRCPNCHGYIFR
jgi:hypothetical protein